MNVVYSLVAAVFIFSTAHAEASSFIGGYWGFQTTKQCLRFLKCATAKPHDRPPMRPGFTEEDRMRGLKKMCRDEKRLPAWLNGADDSCLKSGDKPVSGGVFCLKSGERR